MNVIVNTCKVDLANQTKIASIEELCPTQGKYHGSLDQASKFQEIRDDLPIVGIINILKEVEVVEYKIFDDINEELQCKHHRQLDEHTFL